MIPYLKNKNVVYFFVPAALALCALAARAGTTAPQTVLEIDPAQSRVAFTLDSVLHTVHGTFKLKHGVIRFDPATGAAGGEMVVDATSGESGNSSRDRKMHKSVLESARYSEIVFAPDRVEGKWSPQGTSQLSVHGLFTIHGVAHEMTLPFQVQSSPEQIVADTTFAVPYVKWGMKNPSTFILRVNEQVNISIHAVGHITSGSPGARLSRLTR